MTVLLFFVGYTLQISSRNIIIGLPFFIFCVLLNLIKGFSLKAIQAMKYVWEEVTPEKIDQVSKHCQRLERIQGGKFGFVVFFIIFCLVLFMPDLILFVKGIKQNFAISALIVDSIIIFGGLVLSGRRSVWIPNNLSKKIAVIQRMLSHPNFTKDPGLKMIPYLELGETKSGSFPNDTRLLIKFKDAPADFIGIQFQISINNVQGNVYPYCYSVIIARPSFNLFEKFKPVSLNKITIETEKSSDADVIVIRQTTTKYAGFHTNHSMQDYILSTSIEIAKKILHA
ncbi:MAG: hypothetical protein ACUVTF_08140 [bacterium]